jgi:hypothetical protein
MRRVELSRRRTGAVTWGLYQDSADPTRFIETFLASSWSEHLAQHHALHRGGPWFREAGEISSAGHLVSPTLWRGRCEAGSASCSVGNTAVHSVDSVGIGKSSLQVAAVGRTRLAPCLRDRSLLYKVACKLLSVPGVLLRRDTAQDAELLVLRHENAVLQNAVLRRQIAVRGHGTIVIEESRNRRRARCAASPSSSASAAAAALDDRHPSTYAATQVRNDVHHLVRSSRRAGPTG